jgi:hypothetical protein
VPSSREVLKRGQGFINLFCARLLLLTVFFCNKIHPLHANTSKKHSLRGIDERIKISSIEPCIVYSVKKVFWKRNMTFCCFHIWRHPLPFPFSWHRQASLKRKKTQKEVRKVDI